MPKSVKSLQDYYKHHISSIKGNLGRRGDESISRSNSQELIDYYYLSYKLPVITLLKGGEAEVISDKPSSSHNNPNCVPVTLIFNVKIEKRIYDSLRLEMKNPKLNNKFKVQFDKKGFFIRTKVTLQSAKQVKKNAEQFIDDLITAKNSEIEKRNGLFKSEISDIITERKQGLKAQEEMIVQLSKIIPLTKKTTPTSPIVPLKKKKQIRINPPRSKISEDPKIDPKILEAIIDLLVKAGQTFESTPETFCKLNEYDLRNVMLSFLNGNFEIHAVAEAFNKLGKTDISLLYSGNNLFIAECKFWSGKDRYPNTIDQLFRYLSWRENIGVLIIFVKEKNFTAIISKAKDATTSHDSFISDSLKEKAKSYFITKHRFPDDKDKTVQIHHLLFTLYYSNKKSSK